MNRTLLVILGFFIFVNSSVRAQTEQHLKHLDNYFEKARIDWQVPGMAIAIVKDGNVLFQKGYGYRDIEKQLPVDAYTLFAIASNTKPFTASALALLVEDGEMDWDDKVIEYLPNFRMKDPYVTQNLTIEDILCHRSGLKTFSGDLLWFGTNKTVEEIIGAIQHLEPVNDFRADYGYSNLMYLVAGKILEINSGQTWSSFINSAFLDKLSMQRTLFSTDQLRAYKNVAKPYYLSNDELLELDWTNWDNIRAAGGLISCTDDMTRWLIMNAGKGTYNEESILHESMFEKLTTPYISHSVNAWMRKNIPSTHFRGNGLGWSLKDKHGRKIISHGGGYDGMISKTFIVPEEKLGMVILTNSINYLPSAIMEKTLDVLLAGDLEGLDYSSMYLASFEHNKNKKELEANEIEKQRASLDLNRLPLKAYCGLYEDKIYGQIKIEESGPNLSISFLPTAIFKTEFKHWNGHIFTLKFDRHKSSLPMGKLWFDLDQNGKVSTLHVDIKNPDLDFREFKFKRIDPNSLK